MIKRSSEKLLELFNHHEVVEFKQIQTALNNASRATSFRYLQHVSYHRSYNFNGRYYTRKDPTRYDRFGLFSYHHIHFSRDPTLGETLRRLVSEAEAGWTQRELQDTLKVRLQVMLLSTFRQNKVAREKINGFYVYLHTDPTVQATQLSRRRKKVELSEIANRTRGLYVNNQEVILILLTLLHHPGSKEVDVVRYLRGHSPPVTSAVIQEVFSRYELKTIGEKGGTLNY